MSDLINGTYSEADGLQLDTATNIERLNEVVDLERRLKNNAFERIAKLEKNIDMALTAIDAGESKRDIAAALKEAK